MCCLKINGHYKTIDCTSDVLGCYDKLKLPVLDENIDIFVSSISSR